VASLSCETDFVASTDIFKQYAAMLLELLAKHGKTIREDEYPNIKLDTYLKGIDSQFASMSILDGLKHVISKTQENCKIGQFNVYEYSEKDTIGTYLHNSINHNIGIKGSYVVLNSKHPEVTELAEKLAMQVIASNPKWLNKQDVPTEVYEAEKKIIQENVANEQTGKKQDIIDRIVNSKLGNWMEETVLNEQQFVIVDHESTSKAKVNQIVQEKGKELSLPEPLKIVDFKLLI
jgi:elongation factor Ts